MPYTFRLLFIVVISNVHSVVVVIVFVVVVWVVTKVLQTDANDGIDMRGDFFGTTTHKGLESLLVDAGGERRKGSGRSHTSKAKGTDPFSRREKNKSTFEPNGAYLP